jgi:hypothetical protein
MTQAPLKSWNPEQELTALLDILSEELLAVPEADLAAWCRETGDRHRDQIAALRNLTMSADTGLGMASVPGGEAPGPRNPITRHHS